MTEHKIISDVSSSSSVWKTPIFGDRYADFAFGNNK